MIFMSFCQHSQRFSIFLLNCDAFLTNMKREDSYYMQEAMKEAQLAAEQGEVPIGAVVVHNDRIIARAHNLTETLNDTTAHAEMQAITSATNFIGGKYLTGCSIYVTVEPCPMCASALFWSKIDRVVFGARDEKRGATLFQPSLYHPKTQVTGGILAEECAAIMKDFFKSRR